ncbi:MAG TPA: hypothetical protein VFS26_03285 [Solirubrobacterales bacterium]|nr:hypothetical protein [Solirubrobacterales bacterium]
MTQLIRTSLARAFSPRPRPLPEPPPHFHSGAQGNPAVCFDARCDRPRLDA